MDSTEPTAASRRKPLTATDMTALARIARNFVEANERRDPGHRWPTLNEMAALDSLRDSIASLDRKTNG